MVGVIPDINEKGGWGVPQSSGCQQILRSVGGTWFEGTPGLKRKPVFLAMPFVIASEQHKKEWSAEKMASSCSFCGYCWNATKYQPPLKRFGLMTPEHRLGKLVRETNNKINNCCLK